MANAIPILEQIIENLVGVLATVTVANGYQTNLTVLRPKPGVGIPMQNGLAVVTLGAAKVDVPPEIAQQWRQEILIDICIISPESSTTSIDTLRVTAMADAAKALLGSYTMGGLAIDTQQGDYVFSPIDEQASVGYVTGVFDVIYRTIYGDPYTII